MKKTIQCTQCGGADFKKESNETVRCVYCHSLFQVVEPKAKQPKVIVKSGANVVFGKNVKIGGGLLIEDGANVTINGDLGLLESSSPEEIESAKLKLKKLG
jgi:uncharacterized Zn finger protein